MNLSKASLSAESTVMTSLFGFGTAKFYFRDTQILAAKRMVTDSMSSITILVSPPTLAILAILIGLLIVLIGFNAFNFIAMAVGIMIMGIGVWRLALKIKQYVYRH